MPENAAPAAATGSAGSVLLDRRASLLVVVDMQEPFLNAIHGRDALTANVVLLCRAAGVLGVPVVATTQYAARMGGVVPEVAEAIGGSGGGDGGALDKLRFSCLGAAGFLERLPGKRQVVLCGVETHICVTQTAADLLRLGLAVHIAADAVSSRTFEKHKLGMERLRDIGALPCASEAAVYEWLHEAGTPEFKQILALVK
jgi:nicotinamidase-related amidase